MLDMIGWRIEPAPEDAGVPPCVAELLARTFTDAAQVTFRTSRRDLSVAPSQTGADLITELSVGLLDTLRGRRRIQVSTRSAATAASLFDDPEYPWWLGAQAALLSAQDVLPTAMRSEDWDALMGDSWTTASAGLASTGITAVCRAGVDGDVVGLWSRDTAIADALLGSIRTNAEAVGLGWAEVNEAEF
ncbi:hypothetical protein [Sphingomonas sp. PB4P5]|uniref:hypothetical protein n=1 Tax=Parasphingomonas puruogangriensis TaxID=3096155 RepID=UPI002FC5E7E9